MDLSTTWLGIPLPHPLVPGASPLVDDLDTVKRLVDAGAPIIVMHSLFEEQIRTEQMRTIRQLEMHDDAHSEAGSYFPDPVGFHLGPEPYLDQIRAIKETVGVPVVGSLNGVTAGGWLEYAKLIEQAGADALELNVYFLSTDVDERGSEIEARVVEALQAVREATSKPVAVKLSPFWSSLPNLATQLDEAGAAGLVLFNRFYQTDIDVENLVPEPRLTLSDSSELLLRLRWVAILFSRLRAGLAVTGGVHTPVDAVKALMAGASCVQMTSALLRHGPDRLRVTLDGLREWMEEHEYTSVTAMKGSMSLDRTPDPSAFTRANYMRILQAWRP